MKLTFLGAARTVTGSCYLLEVNGKKMLVDCGMFQGSKSIKAFNEKPFAFNPAEIDAMVLDPCPCGSQRIDSPAGKGRL